MKIMKLAVCLFAFLFGSLALSLDVQPGSSPESNSLRYVKIVVSDLQTSMDFYSKYFGMKKGTGMQGIEQGLDWNSDDKSTGLMLVYSPEGHNRFSDISPGTAWLVVFVPDIEQINNQLSNDGYKSVGEPFRYKSAIIQFIKDPDGNQIELIQDTSDTRQQPPWLSYVKIATIDREKSTGFYTKYLGMKEGEDVGGIERGLDWNSNTQGAGIQLVYNQEGNKRASRIYPGTEWLVVYVSDINRVAQQLANDGYKNLFDQKKSDRMILVKDPDGNIIEVVKDNAGKSDH